MRSRLAAAVMAALVTQGAFALPMDPSRTAVTDMNPRTMLSVSQVEVEGTTPYLFYAARAGKYYFWGSADGAAATQSTVSVRSPGFHRFRNPGRTYVLQSCSAPIALWFGDGPVTYRALPPPKKSADAHLFGKLWYCEPDGEAALREIPAEDARRVAKGGCAFLTPLRFWSQVSSDTRFEPRCGISFAAQPTERERSQMEELIAGTPFASPGRPRRAVVFSRGDCRGVAPGFASVAFRLAADRTGAFSVEAESDLRRLSDGEYLAGFDAVVLNDLFCDGAQGMQDAVGALTSYVEKGGGLVLLHASVAGLAGSAAETHPWPSSGEWGFVNERPGHAVNAPFARLPTLMRFAGPICADPVPPAARASCTALVTLDMSDTPTQAALDRWSVGNPRAAAVQPEDTVVSFVRTVGRGRVFYTSFGGDGRAFTDSRLPHMLLGLQWALGDVASIPRRDESCLADRLWMWGHEPETWHRYTEAFERLGFSVSNHCGQAEGCRLMGIRRDCIIRWQSFPRLPISEEKAAEFNRLDELAWSITDSDKTRTFLEKVDVAIAMKKRLPKLTTVFLDDYFQSHMRPIEELKTARERVHAAGLRMAAVMYADVEGYRESDLPSVRLCDAIALWFWNTRSFATMEQDVRRARGFLGPDMPLMLGLYMWNFGDGFAPVTGPKMKAQLAIAGRLLREGTVTDLIFHPTTSADMDVPSVNISKQWIRDLSERGR